MNKNINANADVLKIQRFKATDGGRSMLHSHMTEVSDSNSSHAQFEMENSNSTRYLDVRLDERLNDENL